MFDKPTLVTSYQLLYDLRDAVLFIRSADVTGRFFRDPIRISDGVGYACVAQHRHIIFRIAEGHDLPRPDASPLG